MWRQAISVYARDVLYDLVGQYDYIVIDMICWQVLNTHSW